VRKGLRSIEPKYQKFRRILKQMPYAADFLGRLKIYDEKRSLYCDPDGRRLLGG